MTPVGLHEEPCTFRVRCDGAQQAKVVIDFPSGTSQIFSLRQVRPGVWETSLHLAPGEYRFCYYLYDGRALTYVTPAGLETDGLKAILHVEAGVSAASVTRHGHALRQHPALTRQGNALRSVPAPQ